MELRRDRRGQKNILSIANTLFYSGGVGAVLKISASQSWGPRFDSWPGRGLNIWWPSFPLKFTLSILPGSVKWVPAYMDQFEAAARGAYICFRPAGGKLIIVKRLWACYMEKALYKCTTLLYFIQWYNLKVNWWTLKFISIKLNVIGSEPRHTRRGWSWYWVSRHEGLLCSDYQVKWSYWVMERKCCKLAQGVVLYISR